MDCHNCEKAYARARQYRRPLPIEVSFRMESCDGEANTRSGRTLVLEGRHLAQMKIMRDRNLCTPITSFLLNDIPVEMSFRMELSCQLLAPDHDENVFGALAERFTKISVGIFA